jgi:hypothetical protein
VVRGERNDVVDYLSAHGWTTAASEVAELLAAHGLSLPIGADEESETRTGLQYVTAKRT